MVISMLAFVAAVSSAAIGVPIATTSLTKKDKNQVTNIARNQVNQLAPGLAVASAQSANGEQREQRGYGRRP
jgi:hypothetical protein